jgi:hypothetical protein
MSANGEVAASADGLELQYYTWRQQLKDTICASSAGKAAVQVSV